MISNEFQIIWNDIRNNKSIDEIKSGLVLFMKDVKGQPQKPLPVKKKAEEINSFINELIRGESSEVAGLSKEEAGMIRELVETVKK